jgi:hypothetical protein
VKLLDGSSESLQARRDIVREFVPGEIGEFPPSARFYCLSDTVVEFVETSFAIDLSPKVDRYLMVEDKVFDLYLNRSYAFGRGSAIRLGTRPEIFEYTKASTQLKVRAGQLVRFTTKTDVRFLRDASVRFEVHTLVEDPDNYNGLIEIFQGHLEVYTTGMERGFASDQLLLFLTDTEVFFLTAGQLQIE